MHRLLRPDELSELDEFRTSGLRLIDGATRAEDPLMSIERFVRAEQRSTLRNGRCTYTDEELIDVSWGLGSLLGDEFVSRLDWDWALIGSGDGARFGIVSKEAALALYPSFFIRDCIEDPARDFTGQLIFNMVAADRFVDVAAGACLDLASNVVRIVPREPLDE